MLTINQVKDLSKTFKINDSVVVREYTQLIFLKELYENKYSAKIFFKGGTAIRLILNGTRFSEDLDFTVNGKKAEFDAFISGFFRKLAKLYGFSFKKRKTITGERYLLTADSNISKYKIFVNLDFSFREKALRPARAIIKIHYPIIFTAFVNYVSEEEILAEKIRAILTRNKGRDIYDLWFLLNKNVLIKKALVKEKLRYYSIKKFRLKDLIDKINQFSRAKFVMDLRPFVPINERGRLSEFFDYVAVYLKDNLRGR